MYIIKNNESSHYKTQFCIKDFSQYYNINYEEIYASIIKIEILNVLFIIIIYYKYNIHDMNIFGDDEVIIGEIKIKLSSHSKMKNLGIMKYFLGLEIECNSYEDIIISQRYYIKHILE